MDEPEGTAQSVVCDAGPLIHLDELGCIDLLADFAQVLVPTAVWREVMQHRPAVLEAPEVQLVQISPKASFTAELEAIARLFALHPGELQSLQVASEEIPAMLLTDDAAARLAARQLQIPVHGTIGVLLRSVRRGQRTAHDVITILNALPSVSTLHIRQSLLDEIIQAVKNST